MVGQFKLSISLPSLSKLKLKNSRDSMTFGGGVVWRLNLTLSSDMLVIQTAHQLWGMLATAVWIFKELKLRLENHSLFMESPKLLLFCRTNVRLYSPLGSTAVWYLGWFPWEGHLHWAHLFPPPAEIMREQPDDPTRSWQRVPWQHLYPVSRDSAATWGLWCLQHPQAAELGVTGLINLKCSHPTGLPSLCSQHTPHCVMDFL